MKKFQITQRNFVWVISLSLFSFFVATRVFAQQVGADDAFGLEAAQGVGLGTADLQELIASIIRGFLGFLGLIAVGIMLYGGFLWMTSNGDDTKIQKARKLLINASIGLVIVLLSYAIASFIINAIVTRTGGGTTGPGTGQTSGGGFTGGGTTGVSFDPRVDCPDPTPDSAEPFVCYLGSETYQNNTQNILRAPGSTLTIFGGDFGDSQTAQSAVYFVRADALEDPAITVEANRRNSITDNAQAIIQECNPEWCLRAEVLSCGEDSTWENSSLTVEVPDLLSIGVLDDEFLVVVQTAQGISIPSDTRSRNALGSLDPNPQDRNDRMILDDQVTPDITCLNPSTGAQSSDVEVIGKNFGNTAGDVIFYNQVSAGSVTWAPELISTIVPLDAITGNVAVTVGGISGNKAKFTVSCDNNTECSTGCCAVFQGADMCARESICKASVGGSCQSSDDCVSGLECRVDEGSTTGVCVAPTQPYIREMSPADGAVGTFVTLSGYNFGDAQGSVVFVNAEGEAFSALAPTQCGSLDTWTDTQVLVAVPPVSQGEYLIRITTATGVVTETSTVFTVNTTTRPGLCSVITPLSVKGFENTNAGTVNDPVIFTGASFQAPVVEGTTQETEFLFSGAQIDVSQVQEESAIYTASGVVPNLAPQKVFAQVCITDNGSQNCSNSVEYVVAQPPRIPRIDSIDVSRGPVGSYVSIVGQHFGSTPQQLRFVGPGANLTYADMLDFPAECGTTSTWSDSNIVIKVPTDENLSTGNYTISITNDENFTTPTSASFELCAVGEGCVLRPGVCKIAPAQGPAGTKVTLYGEGFGTFADQVSQVVFAVAQSVANLSTPAWQDTIIGKTSMVAESPLEVPQGAQTGMVVAQTANGATNGVLFAVDDCRTNESICGETQSVCCGFSGICMTPEQAALSAQQGGCGPLQPPISRLQYNFETGTPGPRPGVPQVKQDISCANGSVQSPSPFMDTTANCVNTGIGATFVDITGTPVVMERANITAETVELWKCASNGATRFDIGFCDFTNVSNKISLQDFVVGDSSFSAHPAQALELNTWYYARLISGGSAIRAVNGFWLDGNANGIPEVDDHYAWGFRVGNDPAACAVHSLEIEPNVKELNTLNEQAVYTASVLAQNCNLLNATRFDWEWSSRLMTGGDGKDVAQLSNERGESGLVLPVQTATPKSQGIVYVEGRAFEPATAEQSRQPVLVRDRNNKLTVDLNIPEISYIYPPDGFVHPATNAYVAIHGTNFGSRQGTGYVEIDGIRADIAQCLDAWSDERILIQVPKAQDIEPHEASSRLLPQAHEAVFAGDAQRLQVHALYGFNEESTTLAQDSVARQDAVLVGVAKEAGTVGQGIRLNQAVPQEEGSQYGVATLQRFDAQEGSIEIWFNPDTLANATILDITDTVTTARRLRIAMTEQGSITISNAAQVILSSAPILEAQRWYQLVITSDGTTLTAYVNGMRVAQATTTTFISNFEAQPTLGIGGENTVTFVDGELRIQTTGTFTGVLDQIGIYGAVMTHEQIAQHYGMTRTQEGILALYQFEEQGVSGVDTSGNAHDLLIADQAQVPARTEGLFGQAVAFTGAQGFEDVSEASLVSHQYTYSAWVRPTNNTNLQYVVASSQGFGLTLGANPACGGSVVCFVTPVGYAGSTTPVTVNEWNHLVGTVDMTTQTITLFVNGQQVAQYTNTTPQMLSVVKSALCLGNAVTAQGCAQGNGLQGTLDTVAVFDRVLEPTAIKRMYGVGDSSIIKVYTSGGTTAQDPKFMRSENIYPFICKLQPNAARGGATISIIGDNFGDRVESVVASVRLGVGSFIKALVGSTRQLFERSSVRTWSNFLVSYTNPFDNPPALVIPISVIINPLSEPFNDEDGSATRTGTESFGDLDGDGSYDQHNYTVAYRSVTNGNVEIKTTSASYLESNVMPFYAPPVIESLSPASGPVDQWVTIKGYNFGATRGKVYFTGASGLVEAELPSACGDAVWSNTQIVAKVPNEARTNGPAITGPVIVTRTVEGNDLGSNTNVVFTVTDAPLGAGLCPLQPNTIRPLESVLVTGERFGATQEAGVNLNLAGTPFQTIRSWQEGAIVVDTTTSVRTGGVQLVKNIKIGEECGGFQIGAFCPGGRVDIFGDVPSNEVQLNVVPTGACYLITESETNEAFTIENGGEVPVHIITADANTLYAWNESQWILYRISVNDAQGTRGRIVATYTPTVTTEMNSRWMYIENTLYASDYQGNLYAITLDETEQTWSPQQIGEVLVQGTHAVYNGQYVFDIQTSGQDIVVRQLNGVQGVTQFAEIGTFTVTAPELFKADALAGVFADARYIYLLDTAGEMALIDWRQQRFETHYTTKSPVTGETNGVINPFTSIAYVGTTAQTPNEVHVYHCVDASAYACTTSADCGQCGTGVSQCIAGSCTPVIKEIAPPQSPVGGFVAIHGCYLGDTGEVYFSDESGQTTRLAVDTPQQCGDTKNGTLWVVEVPDESTVETDDDAFDGPLRLVRQDGGVDVAVETRAISRSQATQAQRDSKDPIYQFGIPNFDVGGEQNMPYVCNLFPNSGNVGDAVTVVGKNFGTQRGTQGGVLFSATQGLQLIPETTYQTCAQQSSEWSDTRICATVPTFAQTGPVEVRAQDARQSNNKVPFTMNEMIVGPLVQASNPANGSTNQCTNAILEVTFTQKIRIADNTTAQDLGVSLWECTPTTALQRAWQMVKGLFVHSTQAQTVMCDQQVPVRLAYRHMNGSQGEHTVLQIIPEQNLRPQKTHRVLLDDARITNEEDVRLNHNLVIDRDGVRTQLLRADAVSPVEILFSTRGNSNPQDFDSGVCQFEDVLISVYNDETGTGQLRTIDYFVCNGENCKLPFDHDQAPSPLGDGPTLPGNQHKYLAVGISQSTDTQYFEDRFEGRSAVSQGDNAYTDDETLTIVNGRLQSQTPGIHYRANAQGGIGYFLSGAPFTTQVQVSTTVGAGVVVGGVRVFTENTEGGVVYVMEQGSTRVTSQPVSWPTAVRMDNWTLEWVSGALTLTVNNNRIVSGAFGNTGEFGFTHTGSGVAQWDNLFIDVKQYNVLKGLYTWSRSDRLDPLRLVTLHPLASEEGIPSVPADTQGDNDNAVQNEQGVVYASTQAIAQGQTKIIIEASTNLGTDSRTIAKQLPINIFICENPWPEINKQFTDDAYNFMTRYCRDVGDAKDPLSNLPAATIIDRDQVE